MGGARLIEDFRVVFTLAIVHIGCAVGCRTSYGNVCCSDFGSVFCCPNRFRSRCQQNSERKDDSRDGACPGHISLPMFPIPVRFRGYCALPGASVQVIVATLEPSCLSVPPLTFAIDPLLVSFTTSPWSP